MTHSIIRGCSGRVLQHLLRSQVPRGQQDWPFGRRLATSPPPANTEKTKTKKRELAKAALRNPLPQASSLGNGGTPNTSPFPPL